MAKRLTVDRFSSWSRLCRLGQERCGGNPGTRFDDRRAFSAGRHGRVRERDGQRRRLRRRQGPRRAGVGRGERRRQERLFGFLDFLRYGFQRYQRHLHLQTQRDDGWSRSIGGPLRKVRVRQQHGIEWRVHRRKSVVRCQRGGPERRRHQPVRSRDVPPRRRHLQAGQQRRRACTDWVPQRDRPRGGRMLA